jgi:hypothetical protein
MSIAVVLPDVDLTSQSTAGTETGALCVSWAWQCPCCGDSYDSELDVCIEDGTPLRKVGHSLPLIWIGCGGRIRHAPAPAPADAPVASEKRLALRGTDRSASRSGAAQLA